MCRSGLERHPSYLSARVTLGRTLQELGEIADARVEYDYVLSLAPDNLAAIRGLAELGAGDGAAHPAPAPARMLFEAAARAPDAAEPRGEPVEPAVPPPEPLAAPSDLPQPPEPTSAPTWIAPDPSEPEPAWSQAPAPGPGEPDFAALDASIERVDAVSAAGAERAAQIERLEIWLAKIEQARDARTHHQ